MLLGAQDIQARAALFRSGNWMPDGCGDGHWVPLCRHHTASSLQAELPASK